MINSLKSLASDISAAGGHLNFLHGNDAITQLVKENNIKVIGFSADYTPFARKRDKLIADLAELVTTHDCLLLGKPVGTSDDSPYKVFSPFHKAFKNTKIPTPSKYIVKNWSNLILDGSNISIDDFPTDISPAINGGRKEGLEILKNIKIQSKYNINRNQLSYNTTHLSAHNKFGTVSIREVYHAFKALPNGGSDLIKQLFWRDFYYNIMMHDPNALKGNYSSKFDGFPWNEPGENFNAWKEGRTGFPVVGACMRELNSTGYMQNRGRMIVADCLIEIVRIEWRLGEVCFGARWFDYDTGLLYY
jgi:deoxyribodipyrimidine photo-lyase